MPFLRKEIHLHFKIFLALLLREGVLFAHDRYVPCRSLWPGAPNAGPRPSSAFSSPRLQGHPQAGQRPRCPGGHRPAVYRDTVPVGMGGGFAGKRAPGCLLIELKRSLLTQYIRDLLVLTALSYPNKLGIHSNKQTEVENWLIQIKYFFF